MLTNYHQEQNTLNLEKINLLLIKTESVGEKQRRTKPPSSPSPLPTLFPGSMSHCSPSSAFLFLQVAQEEWGLGPAHTSSSLLLLFPHHTFPLLPCWALHRLCQEISTCFPMGCRGNPCSVACSTSSPPPSLALAVVPLLPSPLTAGQCSAPAPTLQSLPGLALQPGPRQNLRESLQPHHCQNWAPPPNTPQYSSAISSVFPSRSAEVRYV